MRISQKLVILFLLVGVIPLAFVAVIAYEQASAALTEQSYNNLLAVRETKKGQIESYFAERAGDVKVLAENPMVIGALPEFAGAFARGGLTGDRWRSVEKRWGRLLSSYVRTYGYYDLFLISPSGDVVYTVAKESDLGENLIRGALSSSPLGKAHRIHEAGRSTLVDFEMYAPSNAPASFLIREVRGYGNEVLGAVAVQISLDQINAIMQERTGLGETGETYIVGADRLMRSDSRFFEESSVLKRRVDTVGVNEGLAGRPGEQIIADYRGVPVLSAWAPLAVEGVKWVILSEIDEAEAFGPVATLRNWTVLVGVVMAALVGLLGLLMARSISKPLTHVVEVGKKIALGDVNQERFAFASRDEVGDLGRTFNAMIDYMTEMADAADTISAGNLAVALQPKSTEDRLSNSFVAMVAYLNETADSADEVANGNLAIEMKPRSQEDRLGTSLARMVKNLRELITKVQEAAEQVSAASEEISGGSQATAQGAQQIAQGAEKQASTVEQTSATIQQVSSSVQQVSANTQQQNVAMQEVRAAVERMSAALQEVAKNAGDVARSSTQAADEAREGGDSIKQTVAAMARIGASSEKIGQIIGVITDISEQINLLALNAAIEAARAGEHGRGFAVVAEGVTKLAERSQEAAKEIADVIKETSRIIKAGTEISDKAGEAMNRINASVETVTALIQTISDATEAQAGDSKKVTISIEELGNMTTQITQATEQQAQSAEELVKAAKVLGDISQQNASVAEEASTQAEEASSATEELVAQAQELQQAAAAFRVTA
jgi:methyl-accepting chemotaxis protein